MKTKQFIAGLTILVAAGSAFADAAYPPEQHFVSTKTRAEVQAEVAQARKDGTLTISDDNYPPEQHFVSTKTRAEVRAELAQARKDGTFTITDSYPVIPTSGTASRAEVTRQIAKPESAIYGGS